MAGAAVLRWCSLRLSVLAVAEGRGERASRATTLSSRRPPRLASLLRGSRPGFVRRTLRLESALALLSFARIQQCTPLDAAMFTRLLALAGDGPGCTCDERARLAPAQRDRLCCRSSALRRPRPAFARRPARSLLTLAEPDVGRGATRARPKSLAVARPLLDRTG